jgi:hypothetical protein
VHPDSLSCLKSDIFTLLGQALDWTDWFMLEMHSVTDIEFARTTIWYSHMVCGERVSGCTKPTGSPALGNTENTQNISVGSVEVVDIISLHTTSGQPTDVTSGSTSATKLTRTL